MDDLLEISHSNLISTVSDSKSRNPCFSCPDEEPICTCRVFFNTDSPHIGIIVFHISSKDDKKFLEHYLKYSTIERTGTVHLDLISLALESRSDMVIIPLQDYLGLGNEARINTPSTVGGNWEWRVKEEQLTDELKELIRTLTIKYRTVAEENAKKAAEEAQQ